MLPADDNTDGPGCCGMVLYVFSLLLIVISLPFSLIFCIKVTTVTNSTVKAFSI